MNKIVKAALAALAVIVLMLAINAAVTLFDEYKPENEVKIENKNLPALKSDEGIRILSFYTGGACEGADATAKSDGGKGYSADTDTVLKNAKGIKDLASLSRANVILMQEVDTDSKRSRYVDEASYYNDFANYAGISALYKKCRSTSLLPPNKKLGTGLLTLYKNQITSAQRIPLAENSGKIGALRQKSCMLVSEFEIKNSDKKLVVINFCADKSADSELRRTQTDAVIEYAFEEYQKGNYVVAGGSFFRSLGVSSERYSLPEKSKWNTDVMLSDELEPGWALAYDMTVPTMRLLNTKYISGEENNSLLTADGFIVSPNLKVEMIVTVDQQFRYSSHNPVLIEVSLKG